MIKVELNGALDVQINLKAKRKIKKWKSNKKKNFFFFILYLISNINFWMNIGHWLSPQILNKI